MEGCLIFWISRCSLLVWRMASVEVGAHGRCGPERPVQEVVLVVSMSEVGGTYVIPGIGGCSRCSLRRAHARINPGFAMLLVSWYVRLENEVKEFLG